MSKSIKFVSYFALLLLLSVFIVFLVNLFETKKESFQEKKIPQQEISTFDGQVYDFNSHPNNEFYMINVWATWCINCKLEHGFLMQKKEEGWNIIGLNYKDNMEKASKWLSQYGNPYSLNLYDKNGDYGFNLGVSGAPETYLVKKGKVLQRHIGIMTDKVWNDKFISLIKK